MSSTPESTQNGLFRQDFPEFQDPGLYPDTLLTSLFTRAANYVDPVRWAAQYAYGLELVVAHFLALRQIRIQQAAVGGAPGSVTGPMVSSSVDKVSAAYDTKATTFEGDGAKYWNQSAYGVEFYQLLLTYGMGPVMVS